MALSFFGRAVSLQSSLVRAVPEAPGTRHRDRVAGAEAPAAGWLETRTPLELNTKVPGLEWDGKVAQAGLIVV